MLVKHNNNSISDITSAGQLAQGKMTLISSQTASGSASIEFTSGIDSTYPIYRFEFINIHPANDSSSLQFNLSTDGGSNYNVTKTTTHFYSYHTENDGTATLTYDGGSDLAQSTGNSPITNGIGNGNDESASGEMYLFNPSSTTFVKHFISRSNCYYSGDGSIDTYNAGYGNTSSAINSIKFVVASGNIDSGTIKLYGIKGD
jgi:hypothetical protein